MHVPSDAFQGRSPEIAARDALGRLFTAVAARAKAVSVRARRRWRLAIFSALKRVTPSQARAIEAVEGMARRERFREAVAETARREREKERAR